MAWPRAAHEVRVSTPNGGVHVSTLDEVAHVSTRNGGVHTGAQDLAAPVGAGGPEQGRASAAPVYTVQVRAHTVLRDVALSSDRLDPDAAVDDMLVTLLPGESMQFRVTGAELDSPEALGRPPVPRCVDDSGR
ncbi:hypothetical protein GCM10018793_44080 [Streptomyces sulfonofaciens]|uniref:Uncharacterized protein n=1 Tax=Streptomyces sulfonofaciens TaxID=68272 RepID=A0A919L2Z7_9ACTN|nr:hypothetical protein [Streptomyces sulfonofaciens]GHH83020.1 hypothetical protein GCM10018793_44080 [Streptomyces sulfonofaciens]